MIQTKMTLSLMSKPQPPEPMSKLKEKLKHIVHKVIALNYDYLVVITGDEGIGKTSLALQLCKIVDPNFTAKQAAYNVNQFEELVNSLKPGQALLIDEGIMAFSREAMTKGVRFIIKTLTKCRKLRLFIVICIPQFSLLDKYIRKHRAKTVIRVVKRGRYFVYNKSKLRKMVKWIEKPYKYKKPKPLFKESFRDCKNVFPELWNDCIAKNKAEFSLNPGEIKPTEFHLTTGDLAKSTGMSISRIKELSKLMSEGEYFIWVKGRGPYRKERRYSPKALDFLLKYR